MTTRIDHIDPKNALQNFQHVSLRLGKPGPWSVAALALLLSACAHAGTPAERTAAIARECGGDSEQAMAEVLKSVEAAQPLYEKTIKPRPVDSFRLAGARLRVAAQRGMTPQWLERTIQCHQAKLALEPGLASASDPFSLNGSWIEVEVRPEAESFLVLLRGPGRAENELLVARAQTSVNRADGSVASRR
jgi:hypothetical protein